MYWIRTTKKSIKTSNEHNAVSSKVSKTLYNILKFNLGETYVSISMMKIAIIENAVFSTHKLVTQFGSPGSS